MERRPASFAVMGSLDAPASPVVLSVPHAGRDYPLALRALIRVPLIALAALEDRHVDAVALAARGGETLLLQRTARAWIDLNRGEDERDPKLEEGAAARQPVLSAKLRSGLGLVPRRTPGAGDIWRRRLASDEVAARLAEAHRPYHAALGQALAAARARFGVAVLLDLHSMPPPAAGAARVVIGDRFGRSAAGRFVSRAEAAVRAAGYEAALNAPYAGGYVLQRHGSVRAGVHAIQLELDRALYLDAGLREPGAGLAVTARLVRGIVDALADEVLGKAQLAAE